MSRNTSGFRAQRVAKAISLLRSTDRKNRDFTPLIKDFRLSVHEALYDDAIDVVDAREQFLRAWSLYTDICSCGGISQVHETVAFKRLLRFSVITDAPQLLLLQQQPTLHE